MLSRRWKKSLVWLLAIIVIAPLLAAGGGFIWWRQSLPTLSGEIRLSGLGGETKVIRDKHGIPHIFAASLNDAARTLGYLHAQDRFFQMDISRRVLEGRLATVIGEDGLRFDRLFRTLDLAERGRDSYKALSGEAKAQLEAYAGGVNSWLRESGQALPIEYTVLGMEAEPWQPEDAVIWGKGMAWKLSANWRQDANRAILASQYGRERAERLFPPPRPDWPVTLDPQLDALHFGARFSPAGLFQQANAEIKTTILQALSGLPSIGAGASNEWVVSGARSETGAPLLANDPHLELNIPVLWYLARITMPEITITGASVPGTPHILLGQNGHIAWGFTTTDSDAQDLFIETLAPGETDMYLTPDGPQEIRTETVMIKVKDGDPVPFERRETRHGPVFSGAVSEAASLSAPGTLVSLAWTGLGRSDTSAEAMYRLGLARNRNDFLSALRFYQSPAQNIVYADRSGTIGFVNAGRVPVRKAGDGRYPADGSSGKFDWSGYVSFEDWPKLFNPSAGAIVNANNAVTRLDYPHWFGRDQAAPYRARRILEALAAKPKHSLDSLAEIQTDRQAAHARDLLPFLLKVQPETEQEKQTLDLMRDWDLMADKDRPEALILDWWLRVMNAELLRSGLNPIAPTSGILNASVVVDILRRPDGFCDADGAAGDCTRVIHAALRKTLSDLTARYGADISQWKWGNEHFAVMENQVLDNIPGFRALFGVAFPSDGSFYSVNRGGSLGAADRAYPHQRRSGAGFRGIYDLADPSRSLFIIATGQSEHPLSPFYADQLQLYKQGRYVRLQISEDELNAHSTGTLIFKP